MEVNLQQRWTVGDRLSDGVGAFGRVFLAHGEDGTEAVIKLVPKEEGADRELLLGDLFQAAQAPNVMPILDSGEHGDSLAIVMPRASRSLRRHLIDTTGLLDAEEILEILRDIATALVGIEDQVVHRDLKPENILRFDDAWCVSDFGISRYAEASTAADTRKFMLTERYAAPEQWRFEHATSAADVYAFGVVAYELLAGAPPFKGPDFRREHLHAEPPPLTRGPVRLRALVEECLYKQAEMRPGPKNLLERLAKVTAAPMGAGASRLAAANLREAERLTRDQAVAARLQDEEQRRQAYFDVAKSTYEQIMQPLMEGVIADAPLASIDTSVGHGTMLFVARLRLGRMGVSRVQKVAPWDGPFTVAAEAEVSVRLEQPKNGYVGRAHSLWFCDAQEKGRFSWYELAFMPNPLASRPMSEVAPVSGQPSDVELAFRNVIGSMQLAWPVEEIDRSEPAEFVDRWLGWFADAADGELHHPSRMPEKPTSGSWRRAGGR